MLLHYAFVREQVVTQNGRTYMTKRRRSDEYGARKMRVAGRGCVKEGRGNTKSKWQMSEKRRDTATVHTTTAWSRVRRRFTETYTERKARTAMHHQWKLTVWTLEQPRHCTQASHSPTLSLAATCAAPLQFNLSRLQPHTKTKDGGLWC